MSALDRPFPVQPVLADTRAIAVQVATAKLRGIDSVLAPQSMLDVRPPNLEDVDTVVQVVSSGVMLLVAWFSQQEGLGAVGWQIRLQAWLGELDDDFRKKFGGREDRGFEALVLLLDHIAEAIENSPTIKISRAKN